MKDKLISSLTALSMAATLSGCTAQDTPNDILPESGISEKTETTANTETTTQSEVQTELEIKTEYPCLYSSEELHCKYDNKDIFGMLYTPDDGRKTHPVVILSHGYNSIGNDMKDTAMKLAENGIMTYTYDFCGGGNRTASSGDSTEMSILTEQDDLRHVIDMISALDSADTEQIYLYGESQGGFVSALTGAEMTDRIAGMFLIYPAFCIPDQWKAMDPEKMKEPFDFMGCKLSKKFYDEIPDYDIYEHISKFTNPVKIYHGDKDPVVSISYAEKINETFPDSSLTVVEGAGHGFGGADRLMVQNDICAYFSENGIL